MADVPVISPAEAHRRMQQDPNTLVIDVRDAADIPATGMIPSAANISLGSLTYRADNEVPEEARDPRLSDGDLLQGSAPLQPRLTFPQVARAFKRGPRSLTLVSPPNDRLQPRLEI